MNWTHRRYTLIAFDARALALLHRLTLPRTAAPPDLLPAPDGRHLFLLTGAGSSARLSTLDTRLWRTTVRIAMPHRFRYSVDGPTTMVLAPDGGQLFVAGYRFLGGSNADYWLTVVDPRTLHRLSARIPLPNCGASHLAQAAGQIVVLCTDSNDVRFADPATDRVTSTVSLHAMPVGLAVSRNGTDLYIVTDDLRILVVDAGTHRLVREVTAYRREAQTVPTLSSVAVTSDGAHLVVGVMARPRDPGSAFSLRVFALPSLTLVKSVPLPHFTHIVAAPGGGLYTFPMLDSPVADQNAPLQLLSPNLTRVQTAGRLRSPLNEVMIPGLNPQG